MEQQRKVKTIPATLTPITATPIGENKKRRVAAYARVSTDHDEQFTSYEAQIDYYTKYIKSRSDWEFVKVYRRGNFRHRNEKENRLPHHDR